MNKTGMFLHSAEDFTKIISDRPLFLSLLELLCQIIIRLLHAVKCGNYSVKLWIF